MLAETKNLSEEQLHELGKWWKQRQQAKQAKGLPPQEQRPAAAPQAKRQAEPDSGMSDFEKELSGASWMSDEPEAFGKKEPEAAKTQTNMRRTIDINPNERRPARNVGISESRLREMISLVIKKSLK